MDFPTATEQVRIAQQARRSGFHTKSSSERWLNVSNELHNTHSLHLSPRRTTSTKNQYGVGVGAVPYPSSPTRASPNKKKTTMTTSMVRTQSKSSLTKRGRGAPAVSRGVLKNSRNRQFASSSNSSAADSDKQEEQAQQEQLKRGRNAGPSSPLAVRRDHEAGNIQAPEGGIGQMLTLAIIDAECEAARARGSDRRSRSGEDDADHPHERNGGLEEPRRGLSVERRARGDDDFVEVDGDDRDHERALVLQVAERLVRTILGSTSSNNIGNSEGNNGEQQRHDQSTSGSRAGCSLTVDDCQAALHKAMEQRMECEYLGSRLAKAEKELDDEINANNKENEQFSVTIDRLNREKIALNRENAELQSTIENLMIERQQQARTVGIGDRHHNAEGSVVPLRVIADDDDDDDDHEGNSFGDNNNDAAVHVINCIDDDVITSIRDTFNDKACSDDEKVEKATTALKSLQGRLRHSLHRHERLETRISALRHAVETKERQLEEKDARIYRLEKEQQHQMQLLTSAGDGGYRLHHTGYHSRGEDGSVWSSGSSLTDVSSSPQRRGQNWGSYASLAPVVHNNSNNAGSEENAPTSSRVEALRRQHREREVAVRDRVVQMRALQRHESPMVNDDNYHHSDGNPFAHNNNSLIDLTVQLEEIQNALQQAHKRNAELEKKLEETEDNMRIKEQRFSDVEVETQSRLQEAKELLSKKETELADLRKATEKMESNSGELKAWCAVQAKALKAMTKAIKKSEAEVEELRKQLAENANKTSALDADKNNKNNAGESVEAGFEVSIENVELVELQRQLHVSESTIEDLTEKQAQSAAEIADIRARLDEAMAKIGILREQLQTAHRDTEELKDKQQVSEAAEAKMRIRLEESKVEVRELQIELKAARDDFDVTNELKEQCERENMKLRSALDDSSSRAIELTEQLRDIGDELGSTKKKLESSEIEETKLRTSLEESKDELEHRLETLHQELEMEKTRSEAAERVLQERLEAARAQLLESEKGLDRQKEVEMEMQRRLESMYVELEESKSVGRQQTEAVEKELQRRVDALNLELEESKNGREQSETAERELQRRIESLYLELEGEKKAREQSDVAENELRVAFGRKNVEVAELQKLLHSLPLLLEGPNTTRQQHQQVDEEDHSESTQLQTPLEASHAKIKKTIEEWRVRHDKGAARESELRASLDVASLKISLLQKQLHVSRSLVEDPGIATSELKSTLTEAKAEINALREQLIASQDSLEKSKDKLSHSEMTISALRVALKKSYVEMTEFRSQQHSCDTTVSVLSSWSDESSRSKSSSKSANEDEERGIRENAGGGRPAPPCQTQHAKSSNEKIIKLTGKLEITLLELEKCEEERNRLQEALDVAKTQLTQLRMKLGTSEDALIDTSASLQELSNRVTEANTKTESILADAQAQTSDLQNDLELTRAELDASKIRLEILERKESSWKQTEQQLAESRSSLSELHEELAEARTRANEAEHRVHFLEMHLREMDGKNSRQVVKQLEADKETLLAETDKLQNEITKKSTTIEELEQERNYSRAKMTELSRILHARDKTETDALLQKKCIECAELWAETVHLKRKLDVVSAESKALRQDCEMKKKLVSELASSWDASASTEENMAKLQQDHDLSVKQATEMSIKLAESQMTIDKLSEDLRVARRNSEGHAQPPRRDSVNSESTPRGASPLRLSPDS